MSERSRLNSTKKQKNAETGQHTEPGIHSRRTVNLQQDMRDLRAGKTTMSWRERAAAEPLLADPPGIFKVWSLGRGHAISLEGEEWNWNPWKPG